MTHAVDQAGAVACFLIQNLAQVIADLGLVLPVVDILLHLLKLLDDAQVCTAVARALQRGNRSRDRRIGIRTGRRSNTHGERRVVTAAMLGVQDQTAVEQLSLVIVEFAGRTDEVQNILCSRTVRIRHMQEHGIIIKVAAFCLIRMRNDNRELGHQADALTHNVLDRGFIRVRIIGIQCQRCACQLVHDVAARRTHDHILGEVVRQGTLQTDGVLKFRQLTAARQLAAHKQITDLLKAEAVFLLQTVNQIVYIISAIGQAAFDRLALALVQNIAVYVAQMRSTDQNTGTVRVTQAALDAVARKQIRWELVVHTKALTQFMQKFFLYIIRLNRHSAFSFPSQ